MYEFYMQLHPCICFSPKEYSKDVLGYSKWIFSTSGNKLTASRS